MPQAPLRHKTTPCRSSGKVPQAPLRHKTNPITASRHYTVTVDARHIGCSLK